MAEDSTVVSFTMAAERPSNPTQPVQLFHLNLQILRGTHRLSYITMIAHLAKQLRRIRNLEC
jgi:hypothetical protein